MHPIPSPLTPVLIALASAAVGAPAAAQRTISGTAEIAVPVPASGSGLTVFVQGLQLGPCGTSNVLRAPF